MNWLRDLFTRMARFDLWESIRLKITVGILVIVSIILIAAGQLAITEQREKALQQMENYGSELVNFIAQISIIPIRKYSIYQLENYVIQLERGELVAFCEIYDEDNQPLILRTEMEKASLEETNKKRDIKVFASPIDDEGTIIGSVEIGIDVTGLKEKIDRNSLFIAIAFCLELVLIGVAVSFFIHRNLVAPVLQLSQTTKDIATGNFVTSNQANRRDEIGGLAKAINVMSCNLRESYRTLELKVKERTAELLAAKNVAEKTTRHLEIVGEEVQTLLDNSPVGILFVTNDFIIQRVNLQFYRITGYRDSDILGQSIELFFPESSGFKKVRRKLSRELESHGMFQQTLELRKIDGTSMMCSVNGRLTVGKDETSGVVFSMEDITARLQMEGALLKVKKLESVGVLAGGIAHDFNNILVAIIGNLSLVERLVAHDQKAVELLSAAQKASFRAKDLTLKLLTSAKGEEPEKSATLLSDILKESVDLVLAAQEVGCTFDIAEDLYVTKIDKRQISQVIQNVVLNSEQAIKDGGQIYISCNNVELSEEEIAGLEQGRYVKLHVRDSGTGISREVIDNIFDPYFSTKERDSNQGRGLGLSIVRSIVHQHGGAIFVDSIFGEGTDVVLYLPAVTEVLSVGKISEQILPVGKGRVLVVDSEDDSRMVIQEMLTLLGYECLLANDGEELISLYHQEMALDNSIDAIMVDLQIQDILLKTAKVQLFKTQVPIVGISGPSGKSDIFRLQDSDERDFVATVEKPYQLLDLSKVLSVALS